MKGLIRRAFNHGIPHHAHHNKTKPQQKSDQFTTPLGFLHELTIDNFAGGGGASEGIEQALGRPVDIAIKHDGEALCMHAVNHPGTKHYREDVFDIHPGSIIGQQPIGYAWFHGHILPYEDFHDLATLPEELTLLPQ